MKSEYNILGIDCSLYGDSQKKKKNNKIIIYIHGFANNKNSSKAKHISKIALDMNYDFLCFTLRGNGNSEGEFENMSLTSNIEDLISVINSIDKKYSITLMASSFGASSVIGYFSKHLDINTNIKKIILLAPVIKLQDRLQDKFGVNYEDTLIKNGYINFFHFKDKKNVKLTHQFLKDLRKYDLEKELQLSIPITIIHGTKDKIIESDVSRLYSQKHEHINTILVDDDHNLAKSLHVIKTLL